MEGLAPHELCVRVLNVEPERIFARGRSVSDRQFDDLASPPQTRVIDDRSPGVDDYVDRIVVVVEGVLDCARVVGGREVDFGRTSVDTDPETDVPASGEATVDRAVDFSLGTVETLEDPRRLALEPKPIDASATGRDNRIAALVAQCRHDPPGGESVADRVRVVQFTERIVGRDEQVDCDVRGIATLRRPSGTDFSFGGRRCPRNDGQTQETAQGNPTKCQRISTHRPVAHTNETVSAIE
ncbi:hypothetical protein [Halorientalis pallida]|uniref:Uncharacterized protein n=1 Tax=Halorientalis pallida TaxID=2479928 RepID=A0A498L3G7_9EURY|nr:hypothetical protein [Halorientalis pallida]RXK51871.1 hypothetical protein EAF64_04350 [Halorientalis pallida]